MFKLYKMTVVDWNESGGLSNLPVDQQIVCFKDYIINRLWKESDFSQLFSEHNPSNGQCLGHVIVGGQILKLDGCFEETTKGFIVTSLHIDYKHGSTAISQEAQIQSATDNVKKTIDSEKVNSTSESTSLSSIQTSESVSENITTSQSISEEPLKNAREVIGSFREREKSSTILLFLKNNYELIAKLSKDCFKIHSYEEYKSVSEHNFPFIYKKANQYFIMYSNEKTRQISSSLGAKLLIACNDMNKKEIEILLDTENTKNILLDLRDFIKNTKEDDERVKALKHIQFDEILNELNNVNMVFMSKR